jgi:hypothetical protein
MHKLIKRRNNMKKSQAFYKAQLAVLHEPELDFEEKLEILAVLMEEEKLAKFSERQKEKENETV